MQEAIRPSDEPPWEWATRLAAEHPEARPRPGLAEVLLFAPRCKAMRLVLPVQARLCALPDTWARTEIRSLLDWLLGFVQRRKEVLSELREEDRSRIRHLGVPLLSRGCSLLALGRAPSGVWEWYRGDINSGKWALARSFTFPEFVEGMTPWYESARDRLYFFGGEPQPSIRFFHGNGFDGSLDLQQVVDLGASPQVMPSSRSDQVYILATAAQGHQLLRLHLRDGLVQPIETSEGLAPENPVVFYDHENQDVLVADEASEDTSISIARLNPERLITVTEVTQVQVKLAADTNSWYFPKEGLDPSPTEDPVSKTSGCGCVQFGRSTVPAPVWLAWLLLGVLVLRRRSQ